MSPKELDEWYSIKEYDPESRELDRILKLGRVRGKKVLLVGAYGVMSISFKLQKYAKSIVAVHSDKEIISYCKGKSKEIDFQVGNIARLKFPEKSFDVVVSPWGGLHYRRDKSEIVKGLKRVLNDDGILLVEEADETSEFVKILNLIAPPRKLKIKEKREELRKVLCKEFCVGEVKLSTYYAFKNKNQFRGYFKKEIEFDEKKRFTREMEEKLGGYISGKRTLRVGEKSVFFVCKGK
ncbi:MAG: methyltransferase domain-containing protein [archaeon]